MIEYILGKWTPWFLPRLLGKKYMFGVPGQPVNIYPPQVHAWCCLKRKLWKENGIRQPGIQDLTILATMRPPLARASHIHQRYSSKVWDIPNSSMEVIERESEKETNATKAGGIQGLPTQVHSQRFWKGRIEKKKKRRTAGIQDLLTLHSYQSYDRCTRL